jgi:hypothetical protein
VKKILAAAFGSILTMALATYLLLLSLSRLLEKSEMQWDQDLEE